jgi:hypothetical protein
MDEVTASREAWQRLKSRERKSFDDCIDVGREALPYARPPRGLSNENSLMRQRHFAR